MNFKFISYAIDLMTPKERRYGIILLIVIFFMSILEVLGVASVMPFMAVVANPNIIDTNKYLSAVFLGLDFQDRQSFLIFIGSLTFIFLLLSILIKSFTAWAILRFTFFCEYSLGERFLSSYLRQPYEWFLNQHSASLSKVVLSEVEQVVSGYFLPMLQLVAQALASVAIFSLLFIVDALLAFYVITVLGLAYFLTYIVIRKKIRNLGQKRVYSNELRFKTVTDIFGGIKEIKVHNDEQIFLRRYDAAAKSYAQNQVIAKTMFFLPRYAMEVIAFGGMLLVVIYLLGMSADYSASLPILALYGVAGYRLMPALQQIFAYLSQLRFVSPMLESLHFQYHSVNKDHKPIMLKVIEPFSLLKLEDLFYSYPDAESPALNGLNIIIPVKSSIGLVGPTGSGKTTAIDIILGLLAPQSGALKVDGKALSIDDYPSWSKVVGYVPQNIFLVDDTIAANIAFGVAENEINIKLVEEVAKLANLSDFVEKDCPQKYLTRIGERGVRLSGGQRQRIGIARALYRQPQILVLDEATSALDTLIEQAVMDAVHGLSNKITLVIVAHRLSTVRECEKIYYLEGGSVACSGRYDELMISCDQFRKMAMIGVND